MVLVYSEFIGLIGLLKGNVWSKLKCVTLQNIGRAWVENLTIHRMKKCEEILVQNKK